MSTRLQRPTRVARHVAAALALTWATGALLVAIPAALSAQDQPTQAQGSITGTVTGDAGQPLASVQVTVQNTRNGSVSDENGRYTIVGVAPGTYMVRAQRIGYAPSTQQVTVALDQAAIADFRLTAVATTLSTQVVVGYTTQQRRDISDATAGVTGEQIADQKVATVEEALRGRIPGVEINASGEPGRPAQIIVRGQTFVSGNPSPLYVVDGMYLAQNPNLNPNDIESIEVLKDASAAAQYGSQAANGVVVIRTKRGRPGDARVSLQTYYGVQEVPKRVDMMSTGQWQGTILQAFTNAGWAQDSIPAQYLNPPNVNTDWQRAVFQQGYIQDHNLSISGGSNTANYLIGGGYTDQKGTIIETNFQRYNFRVNSEARRGIFTLGENVALSSTLHRGLNGFPLIDVLRMLPNIPVRDPNNASGYGYGSLDNPTFGTNPVGLQELRNDTQRSNQVIGTGYAEVGLFRNLKYRFNLGVNFENWRRNDFIHTGVLRLNNPTEPARDSAFTDNNTSLLYENLLTFNDAFGSSKLTAVAGLTEQDQRYQRLLAYREGFTDEDLQEIDAGSTNNLNNAGFTRHATSRSILGRGSYTLLDRYILTGTFRRDGSSRFGAGNRYANFAAGSIGWVLSEEGFYKAMPWLSDRVNFFKLRASTGYLGNQDIGDYQFSAPIYSNINYICGTTICSGGTQQTLSNPNIVWQSNHEGNLGLDLGLLDDRFEFNADYYVKTSTGILVRAPLPWSFGTLPDSAPFVNAGSVKDAGVELGLTHRLTSGPFRLTTSANLTTTRNRVLSLGNGGQPIFARGVARTAVGDPIGSFFVFKTNGIFQNEQEVAAAPWQPDAQPGDVRYVDLNGDGVLNDEDRYIAGNGIPKYTYGLQWDGGYSNIDFGLNLRGSHGGKVFNVARWWTERMDEGSNFRQGLRPWSPDNANTSTPRAVWGPAGASNARYNSDRWIESGSYLRIQNLILGYTLPSRLLRGTGFTDVRPRVYVNIQNVHTFSDFSNWDPETLGFGDPLARGVDDGAIYPNPRTVTIGLDLRM